MLYKALKGLRRPHKGLGLKALIRPLGAYKALNVNLTKAVDQSDLQRYLKFISLFCQPKRDPCKTAPYD